MIGVVLDGRWVIEEKVGEGGMGAVYRAQQLSVDRKVAIKTMHSKLAEGEGKNYLERFLREASLASKINHPHLVSIYDFGQTDDDILYLVMEYLDGLSLAKVIENTQVTISQALIIGIQLCQGLSMAHQSHIVHRDLKPENIYLLDMPSGDIFIKVLDFGIAKNLDSNQQMTQTGQVFGTPEYMSPEQCRGSSRIDARSDLYSLGCILYGLVCGEPPFRNESLLKVLFAHVSDEPPSLIPSHKLAHDDADAHQALLALIFKLLEKRPRERPDDVFEVRQALEQIKGQLKHPNFQLPAWRKEGVPSDGEGFYAADTSDFTGARGLSMAATISQRKVESTLEETSSEPHLDVVSAPVSAPATLLRDDELLPTAEPPAPQHKRLILAAIMTLVVIVGSGLVGMLFIKSGSSLPVAPDMTSDAVGPVASAEAPALDMSETRGDATDDALVTPEDMAQPADQGASTSKIPTKTEETQQSDRTAQATKTTKATKATKTTKAQKSADKLSKQDQLRHSLGQRAHSVVQRQSAELANRMRPCVDIALRQGDTFPEQKKVEIVFSYSINPAGKIEELFIDPAKSTSISNTLRGCFTSRASSYRFVSEAEITAPMLVKEQTATFSLPQ